MFVTRRAFVAAWGSRRCQLPGRRAVSHGWLGRRWVPVPSPQAADARLAIRRWTPRRRAGRQRRLGRFGGGPRQAVVLQSVRFRGPCSRRRPATRSAFA